MNWRSFVLVLLGAGCSPTEDPRPSRIAFTIERAGTNRDILTLDPKGGEPQSVAAAEADDETPAWAPDGLTLVFASKRDNHYGLYLWDRKLTMLIGANYRDCAPSWSSDGRRIAFMSNRDESWQIYSVAANGKDEKRLTNSKTNDTWPTWSPDGTTILFQSDRGGQQDLYLMKILPAERDPLPRAEPGKPPPPKPEVEPKWAEDPKPLTNDRAWDGRPAWSPDGKRIVFVSTRDGFRELYIMGADGKDPRRLTTLRGMVHTPSWSPHLPPAK